MKRFNAFSIFLPLLLLFFAFNLNAQTKTQTETQDNPVMLSGDEVTVDVTNEGNDMIVVSDDRVIHRQAEVSLDNKELVYAAANEDQLNPGTDLPDPPLDDTKPDINKFSKWYYALYGVLVWLGGVFGKVFGLKSLVPKYVYVVVSFGVVIAGGFIWYGFDFMMLAITLASTLGIYDILSPLFKKR